MNKTLEEIKLQNSELSQKVMNLTSENVMLKIEANSVYILMDQKNELKSRVSSLEETLNTTFTGE